MSELGLRESAWTTGQGSLETVGYEVTGLRDEHRGVVIRASCSVAGERRWAASLFKAGSPIFMPEETFDSPHSALSAIEGFEK